MARSRRNPNMFGKALQWRKPDKDVIALSLLTLGESCHAFSSFLPSHFTVKSFTLQPDANYSKSIPDKVTDLRSGYVPAITFGLLVGGAVSIVAEHPLPFMVAAASSALMVSLYETALPPGIRGNFNLQNTPALVGQEGTY